MIYVLLECLGVPINASFEPVDPSEISIKEVFLRYLQSGGRGGGERERKRRLKGTTLPRTTSGKQENVKHVRLRRGHQFSFRIALLPQPFLEEGDSTK